MLLRRDIQGLTGIKVSAIRIRVATRVIALLPSIPPKSLKRESRAQPCRQSPQSPSRRPLSARRASGRPRVSIIAFGTNPSPIVPAAHHGASVPRAPRDDFLLDHAAIPASARAQAEDGEEPVESGPETAAEADEEEEEDGQQHANHDSGNGTT
jgi:hypothetical protein